MFIKNFNYNKDQFDIELAKCVNPGDIYVIADSASTEEFEVYLRVDENIDEIELDDEIIGVRLRDGLIRIIKKSNFVLVPKWNPATDFTFPNKEGF